MTKERKRAPGAGRKPRGPFAGNTATMGIRVQPKLRADLEREAKRNKHSLSQEIQNRLKRSFDRKTKDSWYGRTDEDISRNRALVGLLGQLVARLESITGESWRDDRYTFEALLLALPLLLEQREIAPQGDVKVPAKVQKDIDRHGAIYDQLRKPEGAAVMAARGLFDQLMTAQTPPDPLPDKTYYAEEYYQFPKIRRDLGLNGETK